MSDQSKKQPKPFLKKGTRKYLSNATVRSLNQKPNIVEFTEQQTHLHQTKPNAMTFGRNQEDQIKVQVKRNPQRELKQTENKSISIEKAKPKENKPISQQRVASTSISSNKKKPALLEDYLGMGGVQTKKDSKPAPSRQPIKAKAVPAVTTMAAQLCRQQEQLGSSDEEQIKQEYTVTMKNSLNSQVQQQNNLINKAKTPPKFTNPPKKAVIQQPDQICFNSDSEEQHPKVSKPSTTKQPQKPKAYGFNPVLQPQKARWQQEQQNQFIEESDRGPSKVLQKYYKKDVVKPVQQASKPAQIDFKDIPSQIKQQIINQYLTSKKSEIDKKMDELYAQSQKVKKEKEKYEEENKRLVKQREEFQKEMEEKTKEFEQKIKNQNSKLTREKRYMKDQQLIGKGDWKLKNQLEELRSKYEASESEKKKMKAEFQRQNQRLKKKVQELTQQSQSLKQEIKYIEMEKIEMKSKAKQNDKKVQVVKQNNYWEGAPTRSYLYSFAEPNFTLLDVQTAFFNYERLEHYQYYLLKKDLEVDLQREDSDANGKIVRVYKNGKEEIQYVGRVLKENFPSPFKFTVVNHINGDIKLIFPTGMQVYYDSRNQITQFKISTEKSIYYFHKLAQIQLKFRHPHLGDIHELRKGNVLIRNSRKGEQKFKKNEDGSIERLL